MIEPAFLASASPTPEASPIWNPDDEAATRGQDPATLEPAVAPESPGTPQRIPISSRRRRAPVGLGTMLVVSMASAALASVGTLAAAGLIAWPGSSSASAPASAPSAAAEAVTTGSTGQSPTTNTSTTLGAEPTVAVAKEVSPAVVTITSTSSSAPNRFNPFGGTATGVGSGFLITTDGLILTNNHVIDGADTVSVKLMTGIEYPATVVTVDPTHDLAVLKIKATGLPTVALGSSADLQVGQEVIAIGSPLGTLTTTVTSGILSATDRTITVGDQMTGRSTKMTGLLQTDAAINPGNSGGPLLDLEGRVIGINTATASSAEGLGFAVAIDTARALVAEAESASPAA